MKEVGGNLEIPPALQRCQIYQWLRSGELWAKDFVRDVLPHIKVEFATELQHLKRAKADKKGVGNGRETTFAMLLYGGEDGTFTDTKGISHDLATTYYEIDRTLTAVRALFWIRNDQVETFNADLAQAERRLTQSGNAPSERPWTWIRQQFTTSEANVFLPEQAHVCYGLITSVIINDLGKDVRIAEAYEKHTGRALEAANHDAYLRICVDAGMVPSLDRLPQALRASIMRGIEVAAECNLGQTAQAENLPASLYALTRLRHDLVAWRLRFMEQILDLAGARGHIDNTCALVFNTFVAQGNRQCHMVGEQVLRGIKPKEAYDAYLERKYRYLVQEYGFESRLTISNPKHRALMRILCLVGCSNKNIAAVCEEVLLSSPHTESFRDEFIAALNEDGLVRPALQVTYLPALLDGVIRSGWKDSNEMKRGLAAAFEYANACLRVDDSTRKRWRSDGVTVMERDIFEVSQWVKLGHSVDKNGHLHSVDDRSDFVRDPRLLATHHVPEPMVVNRVELGFERDFGDAKWATNVETKL